jgi:hypothetical protein
MEISKPRVVIVGVVRNCGRTVIAEYENLIQACKSLEVVDTFFVESDSDDGTKDRLSDLVNSFDNFHFESLPDLQETIPDRIERIRYCRNRYVSYLRNNFSSEDFDFVIVADMDGINSAVSSYAIDSCFKFDNWDALFSNQFFGLSDLLALRAKGWLERDFLFELEAARVGLRKTFFKDNFIGDITRYLKYDQTRRQIIYKRMRFLGFRKRLIKVESAFGGIAVYRGWCFFEYDYENLESPKECEHVSFNLALSEAGARLFINTRFINSFLNTYNMNRFFLIRLLRLWRWERNKTF